MPSLGNFKFQKPNLRPFWEDSTQPPFFGGEVNGLGPPLWLPCVLSSEVSRSKHARRKWHCNQLALVCNSHLLPKKKTYQGMILEDPISCSIGYKVSYHDVEGFWHTSTKHLNLRKSILMHLQLHRIDLDDAVSRKNVLYKHCTYFGFLLKVCTLLYKISIPKALFLRISILQTWNFNMQPDSRVEISSHHHGREVSSVETESIAQMAIKVHKSSVCIQNWLGPTISSRL